MKKKLYIVTCDCEGYIAVVANSSNGAMRMGRGFLQGEQMCDCEFIDFRCKWKKDFSEEKLGDMEIGAVDDFVLGLKKGIYGYVTECECPKCFNDGQDLYLIDGEVMCSECEKKLNNAECVEDVA